MSTRNAILILCGGLLAACSKGEPTRTAPRPVAVAHPVIHPTVEPIRDPVEETPPADEPEVAARAPRPASRRASHREIHRRVEPAPARHPSAPVAEEAAPAPAAAPAPTPHPAKAPSDDVDEPLLSDQLLADMHDGDDPPAHTEPAIEMDPDPVSAPAKPEPVAAPAGPTSVVSVGGVDAVTQTSLSAAAVRKTLTRYLGGVKQCHIDYLRKAPGATGNVTAQINVGPNGEVALARVMGFAPPLDACIKQALEHAHFAVPTASGGVATTAPFKVHLWLGTKS